MAPTCANCGAERLGDYCHRCGQHYLDRLSIRVLADELAERLSLDRGLLRTVREMTVDPGGVIRRYLTGQRRRYVSPLTYLLFGAGLQLLTFELYDEAVAEWTRTTIGTPRDDTPLLNPAQRLAYADALLAVFARTTYVTLAMCVPFALLVRLVFRRSGLATAEALVFSLFASGQMAAVQAILSPPLYLGLRGNMDVATAVAGVIYLVVLAQIASGFFGAPLRSIVKIAVAFVVSFVVSALLISAVVLAYVRLFL